MLVAFDEKLPLLAGDSIHLQQVVLNLALNAIEAMSAHSGRRRTLTLRTAHTPQRGGEVAVRATGVGIPAAQPQRLFEPFYWTKPDGMGTGLSIAQTIVDAQGGRIWPSRTIAAPACDSRSRRCAARRGATQAARCESQPH
ncbi:MAG TPA: ATP-binding protein [Steroidobacteraceae bacterium]|nr:ATP-binding protein [Steroidobacteraceae bacterium]